jgi:ubiquinone/menaquinone biosynthesis C-methylase UbiE
MGREVSTVADQEHSEWTGRRGKLHGRLLGNRIERAGEEFIFGPSVSAVLEQAEEIAGEGETTILDVGSGSGGLSLPLAAKLAKANLICLDLSEEMLANLKRKAEKARLEGRIRSVLAPASRSGLDNDSIDIAVSNNVFHELDKPGEALAEQLRVLKPGGHIVISDFRSTRLVKIITVAHKGGTGPFKAPEMRQMLEEAGFKDIEVRAIRHRLISRATK